MAVFSGPKIEAIENAIFYVDSKNKRSYFDNNLRSLITGEQQPTLATVENGFMFSQYKTQNLYEDFDIEQLNSLTVSILLDHKPNTRGVAFSINSGDIEGQVDSGNTNHTRRTTETISTNMISESSPVANTENTNHTRRTTETISTNMISESAPVTNTENTNHTYRLSETQSDYIESYESNFDFEMTISADSSKIFAINKNGIYRTELSSFSQNKGASHYFIVFRNYEDGVIPITIYMSDNQPINALPQDINSSENFVNYGLSLFSKLDSNYSNYGIRAVSLFDGELSAAEREQIIRMYSNEK